jgi:hypothetical protein
MITWMTRRFHSATARDLVDKDLAWQAHEAERLWAYLMFGEYGDEDISDLDNTPAIKMWKGYEFALAIYAMELGMVMYNERGIADRANTRISYLIKEEQKEDPTFVFEAPPWAGNEHVIRSHRSNLIRRQPEDYAAKFKGTPANMPYIWPILTDKDPRGYRLMVTKEERELLANGERTIPAKYKKEIYGL